MAEATWNGATIAAAPPPTVETTSPSPLPPSKWSTSSSAGEGPPLPEPPRGQDKRPGIPPNHTLNMLNGDRMRKRKERKKTEGERRST